MTAVEGIAVLGVDEPSSTPHPIVSDEGFFVLDIWDGWDHGLDIWDGWDHGLGDCITGDGFWAWDEVVDVVDNPQDDWLLGAIQAVLESFKLAELVGRAFAGPDSKAPSAKTY